MKIAPNKPKQEGHVYDIVQEWSVMSRDVPTKPEQLPVPVKSTILRLGKRATMKIVRILP